MFHDDQHGTAVITVSAMLNALKLVGKNIEEVSAVVNGAGAAGTACTKLLMALGLKNVVVCDRMGALVPGLPGMTPAQAQLAEETNPPAEVRTPGRGDPRGGRVYGILRPRCAHRGDGEDYGS